MLMRMMMMGKMIIGDWGQRFLLCYHNIDQFIIRYWYWCWCRWYEEEVEEYEDEDEEGEWSKEGMGERRSDREQEEGEEFQSSNEEDDRWSMSQDESIEEGEGGE